MTTPAYDSILSAAAALRRKEISPVDLVEQALARIAALEPRVHAWVRVETESARRAAAERAAEARAGNWRGPLHGIPIGIKDIIDVAGLPTLAGAPIRAGHIAEEDAPLVVELRRAGAVILGKTVTTQFASFDPPPTRNPWNLARTPGGSSSGSAAAVACGMCFAAIGSQTGGSITRPASFCGVAGCKPTWGRVGCAGVVPLSWHLDHPGPLARTVADLAIVLGVLARAPDEFVPAPPAEDYLRTLGERLGRAPRLGLLGEFFLDECDAAVRGATEESLARLREAGATVEWLPVPPSWRDHRDRHLCIMQVEAAEWHRPWFPARRAEYGPAIAQLLDAGWKRSSLEYAEALAHQRRFRRELVTLLTGFDAFVTPATVTPAPGPETTGDPKFNAPWSHSGLPTVSIPCALSPEGLPLSLQFVGRPFQEGRLFGAAAWCERALDFRLVPELARGA